MRLIGVLTFVVYAAAAQAAKPPDPLLDWTRSKAERPGPEATATLEALLRTAMDRPRATLAWARVLALPKKGPALVLLAGDTSTGLAEDKKSRREGVLALASIGADGATLRDRQRVPVPEGLTWKFRPPADVDGDKLADTVAEWEETGPASKRTGIAIARTAPPGITFLELGSESERGGRRTTARADVACFLPVTGSKGQALVIQRHTLSGADGRDGLQILLPLGDGRYGDGRVYAAVFDFDAGEGEKRWRDVFSLRDPTAALRQSERGTCPAAAVLVRSGALGGRRPDALSILGPFAVSAIGVEQAVRRLPKAPRALLVVSVGE